MRSHEEPNDLSKYRASFRRPPYERRKLYRQPCSPRVTDADEEALRTRLAGLVQEHRDLDGAISMLFEARLCDPLLMTRLKKRKLQLKDEIARIEGSPNLTTRSTRAVAAATTVA